MEVTTRDFAQQRHVSRREGLFQHLAGVGSKTQFIQLTPLFGHLAEHLLGASLEAGTRTVGVRFRQEVILIADTFGRGSASSRAGQDLAEQIHRFAVSALFQCFGRSAELLAQVARGRHEQVRFTRFPFRVPDDGSLVLARILAGDKVRLAEDAYDRPRHQISQ